ncbi:hypothetical protein ACQ4LE_000121 [Meloidogyne hapla]|uniref:ALOG domain-containing protein n=1 Tax=Meloidogyne hapla TaxID=6305 RepID=A0A1I8B834_MELHA
MERKQRASSPASYTTYRYYKNIEQMKGSLDSFVGKQKRWILEGNPFLDKNNLIFQHSCSVNGCEAVLREIRALYSDDHCIQLGSSQHNWKLHGVSVEIPMLQHLSDEEKYLMHIPPGVSKFGDSTPAGSKFI